MLIPHQKKTFGTFIFLFILAIPFALAYYHSSNSDIAPYEIFREQYKNLLMTDTVPVLPKSSKNQIVLEKNKKYLTDQTGIVFKGVSKGRVNIDLYILELDPQAPYPLNFTMESVSDGIWLNNVQYRLVSVKGNTLCLKIEDSYSTL